MAVCFGDHNIALINVMVFKRYTLAEKIVTNILSKICCYMLWKMIMWYLMLEFVLHKMSIVQVAMKASVKLTEIHVSGEVNALNVKPPAYIVLFRTSPSGVSFWCTLPAHSSSWRDQRGHRAGYSMFVPKLQWAGTNLIMWMKCLPTSSQFNHIDSNLS